MLNSIYIFIVKKIITIYPPENKLSYLGLSYLHPKLITQNCVVATTIKLG